MFLHAFLFENSRTPCVPSWKKTDEDHEGARDDVPQERNQHDRLSARIWGKLISRYIDYRLSIIIFHLYRFRLARERAEVEGDKNGRNVFYVSGVHLVNVHLGGNQNYPLNPITGTFINHLRMDTQCSGAISVGWTSRGWVGYWAPYDAYAPPSKNKNHLLLYCIICICVVRIGDVITNRIW